MKKVFTLMFLSVFALTSCSNDGAVGPPGPAGPMGPQGPVGEDGFGQVIDVTGDFTAANNYELFVDFNELGIEVFESDAVLVYLKTGEDGEAEGAPVEVFRILPQTYYVEGGELQYNYDFTYFDVAIFLDGTVDFSTLDASYTDDQVFRIVILPAEFAATADVSSMRAVLKGMDIQQNDIKSMRIPQ